MRQGSRVGGLGVGPGLPEVKQKIVPRTVGASQPASWFSRGSTTRAGPMMLLKFRTLEPQDPISLLPKPVSCSPCTESTR